MSKRLVPLTPVDVPNDISFIWPFNLDLGGGAELAYATAQLLCFVDTPDEKTRTYFFSEIPGIAPELAFNDTTVRLLSNTSGRHRKATGLERITNVKTGRSPAITLRSANPGAQAIQIVVLTYADSLNLYKLAWGEEDRAIISPHPVTIDTDETLRVLAPTPEPVDIFVYPRPDPDTKKSNKAANFGRGMLAFLTGVRLGDGMFTKITVPGAPNPAAVKFSAPRAEKIRDAGPAREIPQGKAPKPVAAAPVDADFAAAAAWKIALPAEAWKSPANPLLRIHYTGDVARVLLDGKVILDDFHNGLPLDVPLTRHAEKLTAGAQLTLEILPLRKDAPIMLPDDAHPHFGAKPAIADLRKVEVVQTFAHTLKPAASDGTNEIEDEAEK